MQTTMTTASVTTKQVSVNRPNYYSLFINGVQVSEIRYPSSNPYLRDKNLRQIAEIEAKRIINQ